MKQDSFDTPSTQAESLASLQSAFGKVVETRRKQMDISRRAFSRMALLSESHLRQLEAGKLNLTMLTILKVAFAFGTTPAVLFEEAEHLLDWK